MNQKEFTEVREWWQGHPCGSQTAEAQAFTKEYFEQIERYRYTVEPFIFSFAQFTRYHEKKVLEVGIGAATDFHQWVRAGALAHGVDLTAAAIDHARKRLELSGHRATDLRLGNAESLDYPSDTFDLVYSWGVIHHSPSIEKALGEIIRVTRPGGTCKLMLYHRHSLCAFYIWVKWALLKGHPLRSVSYCLSNFVESPGTKAVTRGEMRDMLAKHGIEHARLEPVLTAQDRLEAHPRFRWFASLLETALGTFPVGWFLLVEFQKPER